MWGFRCARSQSRSRFLPRSPRRGSRERAADGGRGQPAHPHGRSLRAESVGRAVRSTGQTVQIYVRERVKTATVQRGAPRDDRVVFFVHGAGTPAEVAFDVPYADYSWMAYLAAAGFDVFSMDMTGYGRSTRPNVMNEACNLSAEQQTALGAHAVQSDSRGAAHDDRVGLGRHRRRRRVHPRAARRAAREPRRLVARWPARGRLRFAQSGQGREARAARAGVLARRRASNRRSRARRKASRSTRNRMPISRRTGSGRSAARISTSRRPQRRSGARCSSPIPSVRRGGKACGAPRTRRRGASARRPSSACRRRR